LPPVRENPAGFVLERQPAGRCRRSERLLRPARWRPRASPEGPREAGIGQRRPEAQSEGPGEAGIGPQRECLPRSGGMPDRAYDTWGTASRYGVAPSFGRAPLSPTRSRPKAQGEGPAPWGLRAETLSRPLPNPLPRAGEGAKSRHCSRSSLVALPYFCLARLLGCLPGPHRYPYDIISCPAFVPHLSFP
jgi:hypothetical protein